MAMETKQKELINMVSEVGDTLPDQLETFNEAIAMVADSAIDLTENSVGKVADVAALKQEVPLITLSLEE